MDNRLFQKKQLASVNMGVQFSDALQLSDEDFRGYRLDGKELLAVFDVKREGESVYSPGKLRVAFYACGLVKRFYDVDLG